MIARRSSTCSKKHRRASSTSDSRDGRRGLLPPALLLGAATAAGSDALGWGTGRLAPVCAGRPTTSELDQVRLAGTANGGSGDSRGVRRSGPRRLRRRDWRPGRCPTTDAILTIPDVPAALAAAVRAVEPALMRARRPRPEGRLGILRDLPGAPAWAGAGDRRRCARRARASNYATSISGSAAVAQRPVAVAQ